jgi:hypothetical protein
MSSTPDRARRTVTAAEVLDVIVRFVGVQLLADGVALGDLGLDSPLARFRIWELAAARHSGRVEDGERGRHQLLLAATTVGELVDAIVTGLNDNPPHWNATGPGRTDR